MSKNDITLMIFKCGVSKIYLIVMVPNLNAWTIILNRSINEL